VSFSEKAYLPGDDVELTIKFLDFYNEVNKNVTYQVDFFNGNTKISGSTGKVKKEGYATVNVKIPTRLISGLITYSITGEYKKQVVSHMGIIPVVSDKVFVDFYPVNGHMVSGKQTAVYFYAYNDIGQPLMIDADLFESGNLIQSVRTESDGTGVFSFTPESGNDYYLQVSSPIVINQKFSLPEIHPKGLTFSVIENTPGRIIYRLSSGYIDPRLVYLVGHSGGSIVWFSEHEVSNELDVEVDISEWEPGVVQFALLNAAERIEGQHIIYIDNSNMKKLELAPNEGTPARRSKISAKISIPEKGQLVLSSVNDPWISDQLANYNSNILAYPYDFLEEPIANSDIFFERSAGPDMYSAYLHFYTPRIFDWSNILNTQGDYEQPQVDHGLRQNLARYQEIKAFGSETHNDGKIIQTNLLGSNYFYASNANYINDLYKEKVERVPSYKNMLESGTPILDVLRIIKPYNLQGNNIVFMGAANSINYQGGALIAIDGVNRGTDASILSNLSPMDVESISASTDPADIQRYTGLNSVGVIEIVLKGSNNNQEKDKPEKSLESTQFESPDYDESGSNQGEDYRNTLYWLSKTILDSEINEIRYFNADLISDVKFKAMFFPDSGMPETIYFNYRIK
jgi:hypothetical protein